MLLFVFFTYTETILQQFIFIFLLKQKYLSFRAVKTNQDTPLVLLYGTKVGIEGN